MNLVDLIILVCSLADPNACKEQHLLLQSSGSLASCVWQAQPYLAQWVGEHPNVRIAAWHCAWPETEDKPA